MHVAEGAAVSFSWTEVLDALPDSIAVLSPELEILAVNDGWLRFAAENGLQTPDAGLGTRYDTWCTRKGPDSPRTDLLVEGLRAIATGELVRLTYDYDCHAPDRNRWCTMVAAKVGPGIMLLHRETTQDHLVQQAPPPQGIDFLTQNVRPEFRRLDVARFLNRLSQSTLPGLSVHAPAGLVVEADAAWLERGLQEAHGFAGGIEHVLAGRSQTEVTLTLVFRDEPPEAEGEATDHFSWQHWPMGLSMPVLRAVIQAHQGQMLVHGSGQMRIDILLPAAEVEGSTRPGWR